MFDTHESDLDSDSQEDAHGERCGCRHCDPDFYIDPAEREAGARDLRW